MFFSLVVANSNGYVYLMILIFYVAIEFQFSLSFDAPSLQPVLSQFYSISILSSLQMSVACSAP